MPTALSGLPILQQYAQDAARSNVQHVADFLAPTVEVPTMHGRYWIHDKETPLRIPKTQRGIGGTATQVVFGDAKGTYNAEPHALDTPLDELEVNEADQSGYESIVQERADVIAWMGGLSHENRVLEVATDDLGDGTAVDWGANGDPVADMNDAMFDIVKNVLGGSTTELRLLLGANVWKKLHTHPELLKRLPMGATGSSKKGVKTVALEDFRKMLALEAESRVSLSVYDAAAEGQDANLQWTFADGILVFAANPTPNRMDPSYMKTFRLRGYWMKVGQYEKEDGRGQVIKFDWSSDVKVANSGAATLLKPTW